MSRSTRATFPHRRNRDGSIDSICPKCFITIAKSRIEAELRWAESEHGCQGMDLGRMLHMDERVRRRVRVSESECSKLTIFSERNGVLLTTDPRHFRA